MAFLKGLQYDLFYLHEDTFWNKGLRRWHEYFNYKVPYFIPNILSDNLFLVCSRDNFRVLWFVYMKQNLDTFLKINFFKKNHNQDKTSIQLFNFIRILTHKIM